MGELLDGYPRGAAYDEMFAADGGPHPHMRALHDALQLMVSTVSEEVTRRIFAGSVPLKWNLSAPLRSDLAAQP